MQLSANCQYSLKLIFDDDILHPGGNHAYMDYYAVARSLVNVFRVKNIQLDIISADHANATDGYEEAVSTITPGMWYL